jgi:hypothetical protein
LLLALTFLLHGIPKFSIIFFNCFLFIEHGFGVS